MSQEFTIRPLKNEAGEYTGGMNYDPDLLTFDEPKAGKNNMKFTNIKYQGKRVVVETPEMNIPAGVVQYPKAEDVAPGDKVSYSLLMSFDGLSDRPDLQAYKQFLDTIQAQVLDMAQARSIDLFGKLKSKEVLGDLQSLMVRESDKYSPSSAIGLPYTMEGSTMKPGYSTYDFDAVLRLGVQPSGKPKTETIIKSIHDINAKHGSVKVVYPLSAVWSTPKGFGISMKAKEVLVRVQDASEGFAFDIGAKKTDELLEPSDDEAEEVEV
jgi:hypothetical protein